MILFYIRQCTCKYSLNLYNSYFFNTCILKMHILRYHFQYNPTLQHLLLAGNAISEMVPGSLPPLVKHLHVGRNQLQSLNRTLR